MNYNWTNTIGTFLYQKFEDMRRALAFFTVLPVRGGGILYKSQKWGRVHYPTKFNLVCRIRQQWLYLNRQGNYGCVPFATIASNLLAFSSKMADVAATSTDKRSVKLLATYNTRSVHAVTQRAQQNLEDFTANRPCFQQFAVDIMGCVPFPTIASNLLAFSRKMADVAATSTDKRSVTLLTTYNTRSVHAVTQRAQQNLRHFTAIRPCFQQFAVDNMGCVPFATIASNLLAFSRKMADVAATQQTQFDV